MSIAAARGLTIRSASMLPDFALVIPLLPGKQEGMHYCDASLPITSTASSLNFRRRIHRLWFQRRFVSVSTELVAAKAAGKVRAWVGELVTQKIPSWTQGDRLAKGTPKMGLIRLESRHARVVPFSDMRSPIFGST
jgi:hypothetical protein